jgi:hypothetical protein
MNDEFKGFGRMLSWPNRYLCVCPERLKKIKRSIDQDTGCPGSDTAPE